MGLCFSGLVLFPGFWKKIKVLQIRKNKPGMVLYHCERLPILLVFISILNALIKYYPVLLDSQHIVILTAQNHRNISPLYASVLVPDRMLCFFCRSSWLSLNPPVCYVSLTLRCVWIRDLTLVIPSSWATLLFLFFLPPLRLSEGSFSFCTCSLLSHRLALKDQTFLLFHYHFDRSLTTRYCFVRPLFLSPSLIPTSSSRLAYLHCNINSKLYSMLSTCPSVSPISIPPILSTSASLPRSLTTGRTTVRLRGGGGTRWRPTSLNYQTWCLHAVH